MKRNRLVSLLSLLAMIIVGIVLVIYPGGVLETIVRACGAILLVVGLIGILSYFLKKDRMARSLPGLIMALLEVVIGTILLANPAFIVSLFPIITGVLIALTGIANLVTSFDMKRFSLAGWKPAMILSIISIVLGIIIFANPFSTMATLVRIAGVVLLYNGIIGAVIYLIDSRKKPDVIVED